MSDGWIRKAMMLPTSADADPQGCVIAWHMYNGMMVMQWHQAAGNLYISHWMPALKRPKED